MTAADIHKEIAEDARNLGRPVPPALLAATGRQLLLMLLEDVFTTFPNWHMKIEEMVAEGQSVVVRCTVSGTHRGKGKRPVNGGMLLGVEPTNKKFEVDHIHLYKLRVGKIVDHWGTRNDLGMMQQLGLLPKPNVPASKQQKPE